MGDVEALAVRARRAILWRLDHYGPRDAESFQYSRFESEAHAAFDAVLTSEWLAAHVAAARAEEREAAWDEGYEACLTDTEARSAPPGPNGPVDPTMNPYRAFLPASESREDLRPRESDGT